MTAPARIAGKRRNGARERPARLTLKRKEVAMKATRKSTNTTLHVAPTAPPDRLYLAKSTHDEACSRVNALAYFMNYVASNGATIEAVHFGVAAVLIEEELFRAAVAFAEVADLARGEP